MGESEKGRGQKAAINADSKNSAQNLLSWPIKIENDLNAEQFNFLAEPTPYYIEARYGDYRESLSEIIKYGSEV